ncbi:PREDICTED: LOW QUALITY PROTEIN: probable gamma-secretase subunit PEN-2 [Nicotiana attenuata]|uniref:LOW QUALITY PROTEIN: probable gamma-secretase subunit PEN-2 n=1 Tax=Nicotiana attenuata TaxID=49451 RepID=UPI00090528D1|nr:PREDICTED: LOW QUALITY PROTEIN: probable gamma-secretase subunit PEN-2 [Nicotiana attenuata]
MCSLLLHYTVLISNFAAPLRVDWPTVDGPLGLTEQDSVDYARRFFNFGFYSHYQPELRRYVVRSAIGFAVFAVLLSTWALTFSIGGERLFGHAWDKLVMYNVAEKYGLTGWI